MRGKALKNFQSEVIRWGPKKGDKDQDQRIGGQTCRSDLPPLDAIFLIFALEAHASGKKILCCLPEAGVVS